MKCHKKKTAPCGMARGSATSDHQYAYFTPQKSNSVYRYQWSTENWDQLPPSPYRDSGLVIIDGELTTVGGENDSHRTSKLFTLQQDQWIEHYPSMNIARSKAAVVCSSDEKYIFVIGGYGGYGGFSHRRTAAVELFHVKSRKWYDLCDLPQPLHQPSATICDNRLYVMGVYGDGYSFSLKFLLHESSSDEFIVSQSILRIMTWKPLPQRTVTCSTIATLCEQVVVIGGAQDGPPVNDIYQLMNGQWVKIGSMSSSRWLCLVVSSSPDRAVIVGGATEHLLPSQCVEECQGYLLPSDCAEQNQEHLPSHAVQGRFLPSEEAQEQPSHCGRRIM